MLSQDPLLFGDTKIVMSPHSAFLGPCSRAPGLQKRGCLLTAIYALDQASGLSRQQQVLISAPFSYPFTCLTPISPVSPFDTFPF